MQEVFGTTKASESPQNSPKKRKFASVAGSTLTKAQNAMAQASAARERAEKDAADHAAQIASRENRAIRRSSSMTLSSRRSRTVRNAARHSLPVLRASRKTTVSIKHRIPKAIMRTKPRVLDSVNKAPRIAEVVKRNTQSSKARKRILAPHTKTPRTPKPARLSSDSESSSPNITPASLRSAARAASTKKLTQTKLPFKSLNFGPNSNGPNADREIPDSDEEFVAEEDAMTTSQKRGRGRPKGSGSTSKSRSGVKKNVNSPLHGTERIGGSFNMSTG